MIAWFRAVLDRILAAIAGVVAALVAGILGAPATAARRLGPIAIRRGRPSEVVDVRHRVLREGRPRETAIFAGDDLPDTRHWVAVQADRVVGVVTVIRAPMPDAPVAPAPAWQLRGMAVLPELRGEGLGARLLQATHDEVAEPMWCNAREAVVAFYARHGWQVVGATFDIPDVGPHRRMWWPGPAGPR